MLKTDRSEILQASWCLDVDTMFKRSPRFWFQITFRKGLIVQNPIQSSYYELRFRWLNTAMCKNICTFRVDYDRVPYTSGTGTETDLSIIITFTDLQCNSSRKTTSQNGLKWEVVAHERQNKHEP